MRRTKIFPLSLAFILLSGTLPLTSQAAGTPSAEPPFRLALADYIPPAMTTMAVQGNYAYLGAGPSLLVIDISDPDHPQRVAYHLLPAIAKQVAVSAGRVYVLTNEDPYHQGDNQVSIFNIDNPQTPVLIGDYGTANIYCIAAAGVRLFLGSNVGLSI